MKPRPILWFIICLLCLAGAVYFLRLGEEWAAQKKAAPAAPAATPAQGKNSLPTSRETVVSASTAPLGLLTRPQQAAATKPNPLAFRLSNTPKTVGQLLRDDRAILLENALVDTESSTPLTIPDHLRAQGDPGTYIVQACGGLDDAFRAALARAGASIVSYIPNNAYLVRMSASTAQQFSNAAHPCGVLAYEPYFKLKSSLLKNAVKQEPLPADTGLNLVLFADTASATKDELKKLGAEVVGEDRSPF